MWGDMPLGILGAEDRIILKTMLRIWDRMSCIGFTWLKTDASWRLLWTRQWEFPSHKIRRFPWLAEKLLLLRHRSFHITFLKHFTFELLIVISGSSCLCLIVWMNKEFLVIRETNNDPLTSKLLYRSKERDGRLCAHHMTPDLAKWKFHTQYVS
jgi:hypothetical protein